MAEYQATQLITISCCIDDLSPELYPFVIDGLLELGARDAWIAPIIMKKGRPGIKLETLCEVSLKEKIVAFVFKETTSIGLRISQVERIELEREEFKLEVEGELISVKLAYLPDNTLSNLKPELEDCKKLANKSKIPLKQVIARVTKEAMNFLSNNPIQRTK